MEYVEGKPQKFGADTDALLRATKCFFSSWIWSSICSINNVKHSISKARGEFFPVPGGRWSSLQSRLLTLTRMRGGLGLVSLIVLLWNRFKVVKLAFNCWNSHWVNVSKCLLWFFLHVLTFTMSRNASCSSMICSFYLAECRTAVHTRAL